MCYYGKKYRKWGVRMGCKYFPILKWKAGERESLKDFIGTSVLFTPIIELVADEDCDVSDFFSKLEECYKGPIVIDTSNCDDPDRTILQTFLSYASGRDIRPLLNPDDLRALRNGMLPGINKFVLDISVPDSFDGPTFESILPSILELNVARSYEIDLLLDSRKPITDDSEARNALEAYRKLLSKLNNVIGNFSHILIGLTSFPSSLSSMQSGDDLYVRRYDFEIFTKLMNEFGSQPIGAKLEYSDYGVTKFTETELDFSQLKYGILPKIKYTTNEYYFISKGEKDPSHTAWRRNAIDMAKQIVASSFYFGREFSAGDFAIYDKATNPAARPGNSKNWVEYCANHHIAVLVGQLSNLGGT